MLNKIEAILHDECNIRQNDSLIVGVSGGPDSICLLHVLSQVKQPVIAMHINHKLRPEAEQETHFVEQFVRSLGVELIISEVDVPSYALNHSLSIEEAARTLRYQLLFEQAVRNGSIGVAVGHNADDQVETILMHLLRGSGLAGLRGMEYYSIPNPWSKTLALIRPLLSTWRFEILRYLAEQGIQPVYDRSNLDISFFRNRLRHELLPIMEGYNPSIREVFFHMGQTIKDDYSLIQQLTDKAWETILVQQGDGYLRFQIAAFLQQPLAIQRYLLRKGISYHLPGLRDVSFESIERGLSLLTGKMPGSQTDLIAGIRLIKEGEQFFIALWQADLPGSDFPSIQSGGRIIIEIPSIISLDAGWQLETEMTDEMNLDDIESEARLDPFQAWIDVSELDLPLIIRPRKLGDQMRPYGLDGHSAKISDLMVNLKIPNRVRATWPLLCSSNEIVWMPGYRISHNARVKSETIRPVHLKLFRKNST